MFRALTRNVCGAVLAVSAFATPSLAADVTLRYAGTLQTTHHNTVGQYKFVERVEELTNGSIKIEVYPAGQLYKAREIPTAIASGGVDMGFNLTSVWSTDPVSEINDIPFLFKDAEHAGKAWDPDGPLFKAYSAEMERRGFKTIHTMFYGSLFDLGNNGQQLRSGADFEGIKLRAYSKLSAEGLRALGASPVVMSPGEMYLAIQRGTIDGAITGVTALHSRKIWEVVEYSTITGATFGVEAVNISKAKWDTLSEQQQDALLKAGDEVFRWSIAESALQDKLSIAFLKEKGVKTYVLTAEDKEEWRKLFKPARESWKSRASDEHTSLVNWIDSLR